MGVLSIVSSRRSRASESVAGDNSKAGGSVLGGSSIFGGSSRMSAKQRRSMAAMNAASSSSVGGFVLSPQAAAAARRAASVRADAAALARAVRTCGATRAALCTLLLPNGKAADNDASSALGSPLDVEDFVRSSNGVGECAGGVAALRRALAASRLDDPASFAGRYSLFVQWSPDGQHPWDSAAGADAPSATLELAILDESVDGDDDSFGAPLPASKKNFSGGKRPVAAFLDGAAVEYEFADGVLRTKAPMPCAAPDGSVAFVHLQLQFSSGEPAWSTSSSGQGNRAQRHYAAPQCHGLLWFDASSGALPPADWPPAPPRVSGKANLTARPAARSPAGLPSLASFAGEFETLVLPPPAAPAVGSRPRRDGAPRRGLRLKISGDGRTVHLGDRQLRGVQFSRASILSWKAADGLAGGAATPAGWVHCGHHAAGPLLLGRLEEGSDDSSSSSPLFNLMAERAGSPSVFLTVDAIDASAAALEAAGLAAAATAEVEAALASAEIAWSTASSADADVAATDDSSLPDVVNAARAAAVAAVRRALAADAERELLVRAFGAAADVAGLTAMPDEASLGATSAQEEAAEHARAARHAADVAEAAAAVAEAAAAEEGGAEGASSSPQRRRPAAAAAKSATAAFNASRASASACAAEAAASRAAGHARRTRMAGSRYVAALAAASYNLAALAARDATGAAAAAAGAALSAARRHLAELALGEDYAAVRGAADAAEACSRARLLLAADATGAWAAGTARARALAPALTAEAAEAAAEGARALRELAAAASASEAAEGGETHVFVPTTAAVNAAAAAAAAAKMEAAAAAAAAAAAVVAEEEEVVVAVGEEKVVVEDEAVAFVAAAAPVAEDA